MASASRSGLENYIWVTMGDSLVCEDCLIIEAFQPLVGRPLAEWVVRGLPASGHTKCGGHCRCVLVELAYQDTEEGRRLREDRYLQIEWTSEGLAQAGVTPEAVQYFKQLLPGARSIGFTDTELYQMLYGKSLKEMNEILYAALDRAGVEGLPEYGKLWPKRWKLSLKYGDGTL